MTAPGRNCPPIRAPGRRLAELAGVVVGEQLGQRHFAQRLAEHRRRLPVEGGALLLRGDGLGGAGVRRIGGRRRCPRRVRDPRRSGPRCPRCPRRPRARCPRCPRRRRPSCRRRPRTVRRRPLLGRPRLHRRARARVVVGSGSGSAGGGVWRVSWWAIRWMITPVDGWVQGGGAVVGAAQAGQPVRALGEGAHGVGAALIPGPRISAADGVGEPVQPGVERHPVGGEHGAVTRWPSRRRRRRARPSTGTGPRSGCGAPRADRPGRSRRR